MKIVYIVGHFPPHIGGVETLFLDYAKGIKAVGNEVRVVTSSSGGISGKSIQDGIEVYHYDWKLLFGHPLPHKNDMKEHVKWADIVHTTTFTVANPARELCRKYKKPSVITILEVLGDKWYWIETNKLKALAFRLFEKYVCCKPYNYIHVISDSTLNDYVKYYGKRENIVKIYCSIDHGIIDLSKQSTIKFNEYFGITGDAKTFLYFGRPGQSKGIFVYMDAIILLRKKYGERVFDKHRFCFVISDDPLPQKNKFIKLIQQNELEKYVLVRPSVKREELFGIISQTDYVVVPSITEGFGFSATEACLLGKKLIYSDAGSLPEVVSGKVVPFRNMDSDNLAEKLYQVISMGDKAFSELPFKDFRKEDMIDSFIAFYNKIEDFFVS